MNGELLRLGDTEPGARTDPPRIRLVGRNHPSDRGIVPALDIRVVVPTAGSPVGVYSTSETVSLHLVHSGCNITNPSIDLATLACGFSVALMSGDDFDWGFTLMRILDVLGECEALTGLLKAMQEFGQRVTQGERGSTFDETWEFDDTADYYELALILLAAVRRRDHQVIPERSIALRSYDLWWAQQPLPADSDVSREAVVTRFFIEMNRRTIADMLARAA